MKLKVLGSVSPFCNQEKNCPGYLITTEQNKILLDCGNGITRNLNLPDDLNNLIVIISHLHRDHYGDIFSLAYASFVFHNLGLLQNKIKVYIPSHDEDCLQDYNILTNLGEEHFLEIIEYNEKSKLFLESTTISFSENIHNIPSYAIKITDNDQSLVYSGDTGYIGNSIEHFAQDSNLLICESTFLKNQKKNKDYHLSTIEAAYIALSSEVQTLMLTHFWPTIPKEEYLKEAKEIFPRTIIAEENQVLTLK